MSPRRPSVTAAIRAARENVSAVFHAGGRSFTYRYKTREQDAWYELPAMPRLEACQGRREAIAMWAAHLYHEGRGGHPDERTEFVSDVQHRAEQYRQRGAGGPRDALRDTANRWADIGAAVLRP